MNWAYLATFTQTCLLEWPIYHFYLRSKLSLRRSLCFVFLINAFTHPVVFFGFLGLRAPFLYALLVAEVFAYSFEAWACWKLAGLRPRNAVYASALANTASWQFGPILTFYTFSLIGF